MTDILKIFAAVAVGYLLGSLNTSVIVGKIIGKDVRDHGSKGAGLTNTLRVLGKTSAAFVLAGDILKGVVACVIGYYIGVSYASGAATDSVSMLAAGVAAVVGHVWPVYFGFKGGRGALTAVTVLFMANWPMGLVCVALFVLIIALSRYVSLGTVCTVVFGSAISFAPIFRSTFYFNIFACLTSALILLRHTENIKRLLSGTENKLSFTK